MLRETLICAITITTACVSFDDDDNLDVGEDQFELMGGAVAHRPGVVQIRIPNDPQVRTGILVSRDTVMLSRRWVNRSMNAFDFRVRHGNQATAPELQGWFLTVNDYMPMAFLQVQQPFTSVPAITIANRTPAQLVGTTVRCFGFDDATTFGMSTQTITTVDGDREILGSASTIGVEDHDAGAPCFDSSDALVGFVLETRGSGASYRTRIFVANDTRWFIDNMNRLSRVRRTSPNPGGFKLSYISGGELCADTAGNPYDGAAVSSHPCHGGPNQRWLDDTENQTFGMSFINVQTGTCIDVPGGTQVPDTLLQLYRCNGGANQSFFGSDGRLSPASGPLGLGNPRQGTLCMAPSVLAFFGSSRLRQQTCGSPQLRSTEVWSLVL